MTTLKTFGLNGLFLLREMYGGRKKPIQNYPLKLHNYTKALDKIKMLFIKGNNFQKAERELYIPTGQK